MKHCILQTLVDTIKHANNGLKYAYLTRILANYTNYTNYFKELIKILDLFKIK
jgi:hypothetical protein